MLKLRRILQTLTATALLLAATAATAAPVDISADEISRSGDGVIVAKGNVIIKRESETLRADEVLYRTEQKILEARGHVVIESPQATIEAEDAIMQINSKTGHMNKATIILPDGARLVAERVKRIDDQRFEAEELTYSACPIDEESWSIAAAKAELDQQEGSLTVQHSRFQLWDIPVLYTPWWQQPLRRKSGLLMPGIASGKRRGTEVAVPLYFAPYDSFDATITPHWMSARGFMGETELRHISGFGHELIHAAGIRDSVTQRLRGQVKGEILWNLPANLTLAASGNHVSDSDYLADYSADADISSSYLSSMASLSQSGSYGDLSGEWSLLEVHQQNILLQSNARTLQIDPRLESHVQWSLHPNLIANFDQQTTRFERKIGTYGWRMDLNPYIEIPWELGNGGISALLHAGSHHTRYWLSQDTAAAQNIRRALTDKMPTRTTADISLEVRSDFEHIDSGRKWRHVISPIVRFDHIDAPDQSLLPVFDSTFGRLTWNNLMAGNRFTGYDRIERTNRFSAVLETILQHKSDPDEAAIDLLTLRAGLAYDLTLTSIDPVRQATPTKPFSNILGEVILKPLTNISLSGSGQYNSAQNYWATYNGAASYTGDAGNRLSIAYQYTNAKYSVAAQTFRLNGKYRLLDRWNIQGRWDYDALQKITQNALVGIQYQHPCWSLGVEGYRTNRRTGTTNAANTGFRILLEFKGLGSVGS